MTGTLNIKDRSQCRFDIVSLGEVMLRLDPGEERIKGEFEGVKRSWLPLHSVLRIDEVRKQGVSKITALEGGNVAQFPGPIYTPPPGGAGPGK